VYAPYTNGVQPVVTGNTFYGVIDGGFDFLLGPTYKVGAFAGYFHFEEKMNAFGCTPIANTNCIPNVPTSGFPIITETDRWDALRIGAAGEMMLTPRVKLSADVAYLPWVRFNGVDIHYFGNTGQLASINPEWGQHGQGVMVDAVASYYFTPQFSIGIGGRYWALWTSAASNRTFDAEGGPLPTPPQFLKAKVEQAGAFVQMSYKLGN
jgi:outer membrane protease